MTIHLAVSLSTGIGMDHVFHQKYIAAATSVSSPPFSAVAKPNGPVSPPSRRRSVHPQPQLADPGPDSPAGGSWGLSIQRLARIKEKPPYYWLGLQPFWHINHAGLTPCSQKSTQPWFIDVIYWQCLAGSSLWARVFDD